MPNQFQLKNYLDKEDDTIVIDGVNVGSLRYVNNSLTLDLTSENIALTIVGTTPENCFSFSILSEKNTTITLALDQCKAEYISVNCANLQVDKPISTSNKICFNVMESATINAMISANDLCAILSQDRIIVNDNIQAESTTLLAENKIEINAKIHCTPSTILQAKQLIITEHTINRDATLIGNYERKINLAYSNYYIYVPIPKDKVHPERIETAENWQIAEINNNRNVIIYFNGDKDEHGDPCLKNIPNFSKIYIHMHGSSFVPNKLLTQLDDITLSHYEPTKEFLAISDNKTSLTMDEVALCLIHDGLLDNDKENFRIKLFSCDPANKNLRLANFLLATLNKAQQAKEHDKNFRLDYYPGQNVWSCG